MQQGEFGESMTSNQAQTTFLNELHDICSQHRYPLQRLLWNLSTLRPAKSDDQNEFASLIECLTKSDLHHLRRQLQHSAECPSLMVTDLLQYRRRLMSRRYFMQAIERRDEQSRSREKEYQVILDEIERLSNQMSSLDLEVSSLREQNHLLQNYLKAVTSPSSNSILCLSEPHLVSAGGRTSSRADNNTAVYLRATLALVKRQQQKNHLPSKVASATSTISRENSPQPRQYSPLRCRNEILSDRSMAVGGGRMSPVSPSNNGNGSGSHRSILIST